MKTKLILFGCLAIVGAGVWYFLIKDKTESTEGWEDEVNDPVGPIEGHEASELNKSTNSHLREVMHAAKATGPISIAIPGSTY